MNISMKLAYELFNAIELWKEFLEQWGKIVWDCFASSWVSEFMCVEWFKLSNYGNPYILNIYDCTWINDQSNF